MADPAQDFRRQSVRLGLALKAALGGLVKPSNPIPELIDLIGYEQMLRFLIAFGGRVMYVPRLSDLTKTLQAATAALAVFEGRMTRTEALDAYEVTGRELEAPLTMLVEDEKIRARLSLAQKEAVSESGFLDL